MLLIYNQGLQIPMQINAPIEGMAKGVHFVAPKGPNIVKATPGDRIIGLIEIAESHEFSQLYASRITLHCEGEFGSFLFEPREYSLFDMLWAVGPEGILTNRCPMNSEYEPIGYVTRPVEDYVPGVPGVQSQTSYGQVLPFFMRLHHRCCLLPWSEIGGKLQPQKPKPKSDTYPIGSRWDEI